MVADVEGERESRRDRDERGRQQTAVLRLPAMELLVDAVARSTAGEPVALATVVGAWGSVPRHVGAKMLVDVAEGTVGTIGGGRIELEVTRAAAEVAAGAPPRLLRHHLVRDLAMCCGGTMEVYLEPVAPSLEALREALRHWQERRPALLVTPLDGTAKLLEPLAVHAARRPRRDGGQFFEPVWPRERVLLFGAGHVAGAIGPLAARVGFEVVVCDDDELGAVTSPPPWAAKVIESFEIADVERALGTIGAGDFAVIVTRDHALDQRILEQLLGHETLSYLGLIGSVGKIGRFRKRLAAKGLYSDTRWARLHAPIGLDIGAETPEEIAIAVVAELIAERRRASS